ncbi:MAG: SDR family oxidoreductase, partial [Phycisphaeraceae bacterium]|nr:SDR family oxidoreductase [Phycisphaeraceae bacterium]
RLLERGWTVRCLVRDAKKLEARPWADHPNLEVTEADLSDPESANRALTGCDAAYYLIHSMMSAGFDYARRDRQLAEHFRRAAERAGVRRLLYLGGLGELGDGLSEHLASRREVERVLGDGPIPLTTFRAAMIIGSGSASFEILRYLVERLPVMITPRWVRSECQPIAIDDVLDYLAAALDDPRTVGQTLDIGGRDVMNYTQIIQTLAEHLGLRRRIIVPIPLLTPRLSSAWIHLVTPIGYRMARPLAEGLRNRVVCRDDRARRWLKPHPLSIAEAIERAVAHKDSAETFWTDAGAVPGDPEWAGGKVFEDERKITVKATAEQTFEAVCDLGGERGYHKALGLWRLRGWLDRLIGGPGMSRGKKTTTGLQHGSVIDFWRVSKFEPPTELQLTAEMRMPGLATLDFQIEPLGENLCMLRQKARFKPRGLFGIAYWYAVVPLHSIVFKGMSLGLKEAAEALGRKAESSQEAMAS